MLEILVTMVILLVGLLGLAGVMARSSTGEMEAYQRVQATLMAQDMVDRINANRKYANCYSDDGTGRTLGTGFSSTLTCTSGSSAAEQAQAVSDLTKWDAVLKGSAETAGGNNFGAMIGARGCIVRTDATNCVYKVTVAWQGFAKTAAPADACGKDQYGSDDTLRRAVSASVQIANLTGVKPC